MLFPPDEYALWAYIKDFVTYHYLVDCRQISEILIYPYPHERISKLRALS